MRTLNEYVMQASNFHSTKLNEYLSTKVIKTEEDIKFESFCKALYLKSDKYEAKKLYEYFTNDCENVIGDNLEDDQRLATDFELIYMVAAMIKDDNKDQTKIYDIGFKHYKGKNNPYDFSWFEEENKNGKTVLEIMQDLYSSNKYFRDIFNNVYNCVEKSCTKYHDTIDAIWCLYDTLEEY